MSSGQFVCHEYWGDGDPFFGGSADDRALGQSGLFLTGVTLNHRPAVFISREDAILAGKRAANRREGGMISASTASSRVPWWYKPCQDRGDKE